MSARRSDGRNPSETRPIKVSLDELDRADGSARFSFGSTTALASLNGPIEVRIQREQYDQATFEVVHRPLDGIGAPSSRAIESALSTIFPPLLNLGQHPRTLIQLIVQSLSSSNPNPGSNSNSSYPSSSSSSIQRSWPRTEKEDQEQEEEEEIVYGSSSARSGSTLGRGYFSSALKASIINASTLSVLSASSLALRALPLAISLALVPGTNLVLDPTIEEEASAIASFAFAWAVGTGVAGEKTQDDDMDVDGESGVEMELVWVESQGKFTKAQFDEALQLSKVGIREVLATVRESLAEHMARRAIKTSGA